MLARPKPPVLIGAPNTHDFPSRLPSRLLAYLSVKRDEYSHVPPRVSRLETLRAPHGRRSATICRRSCRAYGIQHLWRVSVLEYRLVRVTARCARPLASAWRDALSTFLFVRGLAARALGRYLATHAGRSVRGDGLCTPANAVSGSPPRCSVKIGGYTRRAFGWLRGRLKSCCSGHER